MATALTIDANTVDQIYQRAAGTNYRLRTFQGGYTGTAPAIIEVKLDAVGGGNILPYAPLSSISASAGRWSGQYLIPDSSISGASWYKETVREPTTGTTSAQQANQWSVGDLWVFIGHSLGSYLYKLNGPTAISTSTIRRFVPSGNAMWDLGLAQQSGESVANGGSGSVKIAQRFAAYSGTLTIGIIELEADSTTVAQWVTETNNWVSNGKWNSTTAIDNHDFALVSLVAGNNEAGNADVSTWAADLATVFANCRLLTGRNNSQLKQMIWIPKHGGGVAASNDTVRLAAWNQSQQSGFFFLDVDGDVPTGGDVHYSRPVGIDQVGNRRGYSLAAAYGFATVSPLGPQIQSAYWVPGTNKIYVKMNMHSGGTLVNGAGSASASSMLGFAVTSADASLSSVALVSGAIELTMSGNRVSGHSATLTYDAGASAAWNTDGVNFQNSLIYDTRSDLTANSQGFPLLPSFAPVNISEAPVGPAAALNYYAQRAA